MSPIGPRKAYFRKVRKLLQTTDSNVPAADGRGDPSLFEGVGMAEMCRSCAATGQCARLKRYAGASGEMPVKCLKYARNRDNKTRVTETIE